MQICGTRRGASFLVGCIAGSLAWAASAAAEIGDLTADDVVGQARYTDSTALAIGPSTIGKPAGIAIDRIRNRAYVSDGLNHRVLGWSNANALVSGAPADLVIGQPDFVSWGCNRSLDGSKTPVTMESLCDPAGLAVDTSGNLYVTDTTNCRVLAFDDPYANDTKADHVLGQADGSCYGVTTDASRLFVPRGVTVDGAGNVYVADGSCRVLEFNGPLASNDAMADRVFGQSDFTSRDCAHLYFPQSVSLDPAGNLFVGSTSLVYEFNDPLGGAAARLQANRTLGTTTCNPNGVNSSSTCFPAGVANDSTGRLYVADTLNSRVLGFDTPLSVSQAAAVFGQASFGPPPGGTTFCGNEACNAGGPSGSSLCMHNYSGTSVSCAIYYAGTVAVDGADNLWVADGFNNRVLRFDNPRNGDQVADLVLGQQDMASTAEPVFPLDGPSVGFGDYAYQAFAVDTNNSRVLLYGSFGRQGRTPLAIFGQTDVSSTECNSGGLSAHSLCNPTAVLIFDGYLWIADTGNNRVLRFNPGWFEYDYANRRYVVRRDADFVFGQPDFESNSCRAGSDGLCAPQGLAMDARFNLYISDSGNNRILVDQNPLTTDTRAELVYGQPNFDSTTCKAGAGGAATVCDPRGIAVLSHVDPWGIDQGDDLYIADRGNNRVVLHKSVDVEPSGAPADIVFGQAGNFNGGSCGQGADGLCHPTGVSLDRGGSLLVADTDNNRVLVYEDPESDTKADRVFGQPTLNDRDCNRGSQSPSADSLCLPSNVVASGAYEGHVFVGDTGNNRLLRYEAPYCIESFSLTSQNRATPGIRSKPQSTRVKITRGPSQSSADDTVELKDRLTLLESDGGIYANDPPLFTLATDSSFSTGVAFRESVPNWISNIRSTNEGGVWSTGDLENDHGITFYRVQTNFYIPPGLSDSPQRDRISYKATALGMDLSSFNATQAWYRAQFGSTCFTTELKCRANATGKTICSPAKPAP